MKPSHRIIETFPARPGKKDPYAELLHELLKLQQELLVLESESREIIDKVDVRHRRSAANLIHYLGLRRRDMRPLQEKLAAAGLSSMGRAEAHVLSNLRAIIVLLQRALGKQSQQMPPSLVDSSVQGSALLEINTNNLLGKSPPHRHVRIMVTLPGTAADDYALIREMLLQGMDCARINCAHDDEAVWLRLMRKDI